MTRVEFNLPDEVANDAREVGLLEQDRLEELVRAELRRAAFARFREARAKIDAANVPEMPLDEVCQLVREVRRERREEDAKQTRNR